MDLLNKLFVFSIIFLTAISLAAPAAAQDAKTIEMEGTEQLEYSKTEITAKPGQKVTVKLTNRKQYTGRRHGA